MSYEKELEYLRKEFNKSSAKFHQAEAEGYETDAEIWEDDMVNIGHQIHIHEQATKADEYEAKAKAFDRICEAMDYHYPTVHDRKYLNGYQHPKASLKDIDEIINSYESGEYDA